MSKKQKLEASLLAFNPKDEKVFFEQLDSMQKAGVKIIHYDVIDGKFAPNTAYKTEWLKELFLRGFEVNVHFMVMRPIKWFNEFAIFPFNVLTFQPESVSKLTASFLLNKIRKNHRKCGLAFKPHTDLNEYIKLIKKCDYVTIMGVEPGFGGQKFIPNALDKISYLRNKIDENKLNVLIEVDGGINDSTAEIVKTMGVDILVAGSYLFGKDDVKERIAKLKK